MFNRLLPQSTQAALNNRETDRKVNLSLLLSRYGEPGLVSKEAKQVMEKLLNRWDTCFAKSGAEALRERITASVQRDYSCYSIISGKTIWRAVSGMGDASVFQTSITLHSLYGFPYFRGSAIKGLCNAYAEHWLKKKKIDREPVFGSAADDDSGGMGQVSFLGGYPVGDAATAIEIDIMNPHYRDYYENGSTPPADWCSPIPVYFFTIKQDSSFEFFLGSQDQQYLKTATKWLCEALQNIGLGAKTAAGYGYFSIEKEKTVIKCREKDQTWSSQLYPF